VQEVYGSGPKSEDVFGCSGFFEVQRRRFTCPIVLKNLIGFSAKSRPGPNGNLVPTVGFGMLVIFKETIQDHAKYHCLQ
jgi:hypothetical protein